MLGTRGGADSFLAEQSPDGGPSIPAIKTHLCLCHAHDCGDDEGRPEPQNNSASGDSVVVQRVVFGGQHQAAACRRRQLGG